MSNTERLELGKDIFSAHRSMIVSSEPLTISWMRASVKPREGRIQSFFSRSLSGAIRNCQRCVYRDNDASDCRDLFEVGGDFLVCIRQCFWQRFNKKGHIAMPTQCC